MTTRTRVVLDIETYKNYFLVALKNIENGKSVCFERTPTKELEIGKLIATLKKYTIVTFNGRNYDEPLLRYALKGVSNEQLKKLSDDIIQNNKKPWIVEEEYALAQLHFIDHIDLIEVAPGMASLKVYGGRLHSRRLQDLPIHHDAVLTDADIEVIRPYCINDLDTTIDLYRKLEPQLKLRCDMSEEYGVDLRSKSDAQIAEAVIRSEIEKRKGGRVYKPNFPSDYSFKYQVPEFIRYKTGQLQDVLTTVKTADFTLSDKGDVAEPESIAKLKFDFYGTTYQMGIGGLHSCESTVSYVSDDEYLLVDRDVTSYYPMIILNQKLYPSHLGPDFLEVYKTIVDRRVAAKRAGDKVTDAALKITINGSFGKFGSKWSVLFGPNLLIQTTVTGQLALLMLIEALELAGIHVVSANTDGIVIKCPRSRYEEMTGIIGQWEKATGFNTEETQYAALYSRDVNNYIALKPNGTYKTKGAFAEAGLSKNPTNEVCVMAAVDYLQFGIPIETTIHSCMDIKKFISIRNVTGGAVKGDEFLGRAVRWYYAKGEKGTINYKTNGNKVAKSDGAKPLMSMNGTIPTDIDHEWYVREAREILSDVAGLTTNVAI